MKMIEINGRDCWVYGPDDAKAAVVILHAKMMTALEMAGCVQAEQFAQAGILAVFPNSERVTEWDYSSPMTPDFEYLSELDSEICAIYTTLQSVSLAGLSNGGFMAALIAACALYAYDSFFLVCATLPAGVQLSSNAIPCPVTLLLGSNDPIVPSCGGHGFMSEAATQEAFESVGMQVSVQIFDGGHCWPGGVPPPAITQVMMGKWAKNPSATQIIIGAVGGMS